MHVKQLDFIFFTESGHGAGPSNQEAGQSQAEGGNAATQQIEIEDDDSSTALAPQFDDDSDDDLGTPVFSSTPTLVPKCTDFIQRKVEKIVETFYNSITISGAVTKDVNQSADQATEVGTVEEECNHLIGAEANESAGPAYDVQLLTKLMEAYKVPQRLQFLCLNAQEMRRQSHEDCTPLVLL